LWVVVHPPPEGWPAPGSGPGQPPYGPPQYGAAQGQPTAWQNGQPPFPPPGQGQPPYPPPGQGPYPPPGWQQPPTKPPLYKRPWFIVLAGLVAIGLIGSALGGKDDEGSTPAAASSTVETTPPTSSTVAPPTTQAAVPPVATVLPTTEAAPVAANFAMPDVVGLDLQSAQNLVQTYGVFFSKSHDLLGSRNQLVDSNWMVCDQNIPPGQQVTGDAEGLIDFGVVKREEACP
jgi:hypothetical protein